MMPEHIARALTNWGNWARLHSHYGHCGSIEHRYLHPQHNHWNPPEPKIQVDNLSAELIEKNMRYLEKKQRDSLKFVYVFRWPWPHACQRIRLRADLWDEYFEGAAKKAYFLAFHGNVNEMEINELRTIE